MPESVSRHLVSTSVQFGQSAAGKTESDQWPLRSTASHTSANCHRRNIRPIGRGENRVGSMAVSRPPVRESGHFACALTRPSSSPQRTCADLSAKTVPRRDRGREARISAGLGEPADERLQLGGNQCLDDRARARESFCGGLAAQLFVLRSRASLSPRLKS